MLVEKRRKPRLDIGITVIHDNKRRMTRDISLNGAFLKKDEWDKDMQLLPIGSEIDLSFDFPNTTKYIDVKGTVVHHGNNNDGMGIWFKKMDERNKEFIRQFIKDYL